MDCDRVPCRLRCLFIYLNIVILAFVVAVSGCSNGGGSAEVRGNVSQSDTSPVSTVNTEGQTNTAQSNEGFTVTYLAQRRDITLQWDESIDAPYLQSYRVYYYTESNNPSSLTTADYAVAYTLGGGYVVPIDPLTASKAITIDKNNTWITLHMPDNNKIYHFVLTAIDKRGLESVPTPEVSSQLSQN